MGCKAVCRACEEKVLRHGVRRESPRALHDLLASPIELGRTEFKALLVLGDRLATAQIKAPLLPEPMAESGTHRLNS